MSTSASVDYDVVIVGAGMVGSMLAAALGTAAAVPTQPLRTCVLENTMPQAFAADANDEYDLRVSALSIASQRMLERVGAWHGITDRRACPFKRLAVWDGEARGRTEFKAADIGAQALGHIVENRVIQLALIDKLQQLPDVELRCPARLQSCCYQQDHIQLLLENGEQLSTRLLVGADGANSQVRKLAGIDMQRSTYDQHALVATIDTSIAQQDITWQRFVPTGAQAFLPLCGSRASMVWYHTEDEVSRLKALADDAFIDAVQSAFPVELGDIVRVHARGSFPIAKAHAQTYVAERVALVGDAAHTVHPLAGQGVNLGLLDAGALSDVLLNAAGRGRDIGEQKQLLRYQRWRRADNQLMITALDGIFHAFKAQPAPVRKLRSAALDLVDSTMPVKSVLMQHAMGTAGELPAIAQ